MARQKKDGRHLNLYVEREVCDMLAAYAAEKGQTITMALEQILKAFFEQQSENESN